LLEVIGKELEPFRQQASENFQQTLQALEKNINQHTTNVVSKAVLEIKNQQKEETHSVVLLGDTGVGKSTVARYLSGTLDTGNAENPFKVSHGETVLTNEVHRYTDNVFGGKLEEVKYVKLHIGDTPGLGGTAENIEGEKISDEEVLELIRGHINLHCKGETQGLSAFLLVLDNNADINAESLKLYINKFTAEDLAKNLILVLNRSKLKTMDDETLELFKGEFLEIIGDGRPLRPGTKELVGNIKAVHFNFSKSDNGSKDPCLPKDQEMLHEQLKELVKLIQEKGKHKYRCLKRPLNSSTSPDPCRGNGKKLTKKC